MKLRDNNGWSIDVYTIKNSDNDITTVNTRRGAEQEPKREEKKEKENHKEDFWSLEWY